jgi:putative DNA primase/helicase
MSGETVERARGRWREILPALGIGRQFLVNRHGPCPLCGGKDRYRFDDRDGTGSYFCSQCGAGVGLILLRRKFGWSYGEACREVDQIIGTDSPRPAPQPSKPQTTSRVGYRQSPAS